MLNNEAIHLISPDSGLSMNLSGVDSHLTQEMESLTMLSETALVAADQVSLSRKILDLAEKIRALENNEILI